MNELTAKDLMIGDYVIRKNVPKEILVVDAIDPIRNIVYLDLDGLGITEKIENIEPIPPTPEILAKNGFEKKLDDFGIEYYRYYNRAADGYIKITLYDGGDGDWDLEIVNYDKFNDHEISYKNQFSFLKVHQFQHALRLCGIDKTIVL